MKMRHLFAGLASVLISSSAYAATIAQWTFESSLAGGFSSSGQNAGPFSPEIGTGAATGRHNSSATAYTSPVGNASLRSLSSSTWTTGDYYQFQSSSIGYTDIVVSFDQANTTGGPLNFSLQYSTDGTTFTHFSTYLVTVQSWNSSTPQAASARGPYDLSSIAALVDAATIYFRLRASTSGLTSAGTSRVDNFTISGTALPPPPSSVVAPIPAAWLAGPPRLGLLALRRRRQ